VKTEKASSVCFNICFLFILYSWKYYMEIKFLFFSKVRLEKIASLSMWVKEKISFMMINCFGQGNDKWLDDTGLWWLIFCHSRVNSANILRAHLTHADPKSAKRHWWLDCPFALMGSALAKAVRKHVCEMDPLESI